MKHVEAPRTAFRRSGAGVVFGRAAAVGGIVAIGAAFGVALSLQSADPARAGEQNYVRSSSHEAISNVRLDEEITIVFKSALLPSSVGPDTILLRTGPTRGIQARGSYIIGSFMYDRRAQRRVVIRPEAVQEYFQLVKGYSRVDAARLGQRTIKSVMATGRLSKLAKIDRALVRFFGPSYGAGTRLDNERVFGNYPPVLGPADPIRRYRELIAGDDVKWQTYQKEYFNPTLDPVTGIPDPAAQEQAARFFRDLRANPEYERFYHRVDPITGIASNQSVLRARQYRRVLVDRRAGNRVLFVPEVPIRSDLTDTGYTAGASYSIVIPAYQPGVVNTVLTRKGQRMLLQAGGRDYSTFFTTVPGTVATSGLFLDNESRSGLATLQKPRVINTTPPVGETYVDQTTDWEDPDNNYDTPETGRKAFTVRLRFAQALDPRTVSPANFTMRQVAKNAGSDTPTPVDVLVQVGTFLSQHRLGTVEVEITPVDNPQPDAQYEIVAKGLVKSLGGVLLNTDFRMTFITGQAEPPLDAIRETFNSDGRKANPADPETFAQVSTALWPAPKVYDPFGTGRAVAQFMPFAGTGAGAPSDPPDVTSPIVTDLVVPFGQQITFVTENSDPASADFGKQIEYNYASVQMLGGSSVRTVGRYPLVIRSQTTVLLQSANILVNGLAGGIGIMNTDTVNGPPPGGLGGAPGPGGFRGGDGAGAPETDPLSPGDVVFDDQGKLKFDQAKFDGLDGAPGFQAPGGGSGGFSGDEDAAITQDWDGIGGIGNPGDFPLEPARFREAGGGGGHAEKGQDGDGARGTRKSHNGPLGPYFGGQGGLTYGDGEMTDAPPNSLGVPTLGLNSGGGGGGGGGMEDDAPLGVVGPEDAGGGGGGGGGGSIQICARGDIIVDGASINANGGAGGGTRDAPPPLDLTEGQGAPGGCGAGGTIWLQSFDGDVVITGGAHVEAGGGDNTTSTGEITTSATVPDPIKGKGGRGGNGYVRLEDVDGLFPEIVIDPNQVVGSVFKAVFTPTADGNYPGRDDLIPDDGIDQQVPMVVNTSVIYSQWYNSQLETPTYIAVFDDLSTKGPDNILGTQDDPLEGTSVFDFATQSGGSVLIEARSAPSDTNPLNAGRPNVFGATSWYPISDLTQISDRRFVQFRITFSLPTNYDPSDTNTPRPYVEYLQINIELQ